MFRKNFNYHPVVYSLIAGAFFSRIASSMSLPFLAIYLSLQTEISPVMIGLIAGAAPLASTLTGFIGGALSDKIGRKKVMMISIYIWGLVFLGLGAFQDPWVLFLLNTLNGICKSFFEPVSQALIGDLTDKQSRKKVFSLRYTAINAGVALGPLIGAAGGLSSSGNAFLFTGLFYLIYSVILHLLLNRFDEDTIKQENKILPSFFESFTILKKDRVLLLFLTGGGLTQIAFAQLAPLSHHLAVSFEKGVLMFSTLMTVNALVVVLAQMPLSSLLERFPPIWSTYSGNALYAVGGIGFAYSDSLIGLIAAMVIYTLGEVLCFPSGTVLIDQLAPSHLRGSYYGAHNFKEIGRFIGPSIGMFILTDYGIKHLFWIVMIILILSSLFFWMGERERSRNLKVSPVRLYS